MICQKIPKYGYKNYGLNIELRIYKIFRWNLDFCFYFDENKNVLENILDLI